MASKSLQNWALMLKLWLDTRAVFFRIFFFKLQILRRALDFESLCQSDGGHAFDALNIGHILQLSLSLTVLYPRAFRGTCTKAAFVLLLRDPGDSVPCQGAEIVCYGKKAAGCRALEEEDAEAVGLYVLKQKNS